MYINWSECQQFVYNEQSVVIFWVNWCRNNQGVNFNIPALSNYIKFDFLEIMLLTNQFYLNLFACPFSKFYVFLNKIASRFWNYLIAPSIGRSSISSKHNKENRPLNDRDWQKDVVRELVGFCINNGYQNAALSTKDFHPINTTTFR